MKVTRFGFTFTYSFADSFMRSFMRSFILFIQFTAFHSIHCLSLLPLQFHFPILSFLQYHFQFQTNNNPIDPHSLPFLFLQHVHTTIHSPSRHSPQMIAFLVRKRRVNLLQQLSLRLCLAFHDLLHRPSIEAVAMRHQLTNQLERSFVLRAEHHALHQRFQTEIIDVDVE